MTVAPEPRTEPRIAGIARSTGAVVLIILSVVCLTLSPLAVWGRNLVLDTSGYVSTVAPLASNAQVQTAIIAAVDKQVGDHLDIEAYVNQALQSATPTLSQVAPNLSQSALLSEAAKRLAPSVKKAILALVNTLTTRFVESSQFQRLWTEINQKAHTQIVSLLLTGHTVNSVIKLQNSNVLLDLSAVVSVVKQKLVDAGIGIASRVPNVGATIVVAHVQDFTRIQTGVSALNAVADILPWLGLAFAVLAVLLAHRRGRAVIWLGLGVAAGMCVLALGLSVAEHVLADELVQNGLQSSTVTLIFDTLIRSLRTALRVILVVALLVAIAVWTARFVPTIKPPAGMHDRLLGFYRTPGPRLVRHWATPLEVALVAVLAAILILMDSPPASLVIAFACVVAVWIAAIESCRRLAPASTAEARPDATPQSGGIVEPPARPGAL